MSNIKIIKGSFDTQIELKVERLLIAETTYIGE